MSDVRVSSCYNLVSTSFELIIISRGSFFLSDRHITFSFNFVKWGYIYVNFTWKAAAVSRNTQVNLVLRRVTSKNFHSKAETGEKRLKHFCFAQVVRSRKVIRCVSRKVQNKRTFFILNYEGKGRRIFPPTLRVFLQDQVFCKDSRPFPSARAPGNLISFKIPLQDSHR